MIHNTTNEQDPTDATAKANESSQPQRGNTLGDFAERTPSMNLENSNEDADEADLEDTDLEDTDLDNADAEDTDLDEVDADDADLNEDDAEEEEEESREGLN